MRKQCFFVDMESGEEGTVEIGGDVAHHIRNVIRLKAGDTIELRNGRGGAWDGLIEGCDRGSIWVRVEAKKIHKGYESPFEVTLALAWARPDRMDLALRQATELGIHRFVAFKSERSDYGISGKKLETRRQRWLKIAREALCQCRRLLLPEIETAADIHELIEKAKTWAGEGGAYLRVVAAEKDGEFSLKELWRQNPRCDGVLCLIGPEGGWEDKELDLLKRNYFHAVSLGPRILRLETAATCLAAGVQMFWGDLGESVGKRKIDS